jgi:hypothetical protein
MKGSIKMAKLTLEFVKEQFGQRGYELTEPVYINNHIPLTYLCPNHGEQRICYNSLQNGSGCPICAKESMKIKLKLDFGKIEDLFKTRNYKLTSVKEEYKNSHDTKLKYICPSHPNDIQSISYSNLNNGYGCPMCARDANSRENNWNWKGGITSLTRYLRPLLNSWVQQQLQRVNYRCEITGKQGTLNVHHMFRFKNILQITMDELNMDTRETIGDYTEDELQLITVNLIKNNDLLADPIVMLESVHQEFHKSCGGNDVETTIEQLESWYKIQKFYDEQRFQKIQEHREMYAI